MDGTDLQAGIELETLDVIFYGFVPDAGRVDVAALALSSNPFMRLEISGFVAWRFLVSPGSAVR